MTIMSTSTGTTTSTTATALPTMKENSENNDNERTDGKGDLFDFAPVSSKLEPGLLEPLDLMGLDAQDMSVFADEYAKLQQALRMSHESENRVINKCQAQLKAIRSSQHKLTALASLYQTDQKKLEKLKEEIASHRQMHGTMETDISSLQTESYTLKEEVETTTLCFGILCDTSPQ